MQAKIIATAPDVKSMLALKEMMHALSVSPPPENHSIELHINLSRILRNIQVIREKIGPKTGLFAVLKANAYGLGNTDILVAILSAGIRHIAVARLSEAIELNQFTQKHHLPTAYILLLEIMQPTETVKIIEHNLVPSITKASVAAALEAAAKTAGKTVKVHIKVNTGLNFDGCRLENVVALLRHIKDACNHIIVEGIYTHFSEADSDVKYTRGQIHEFNTLLDTLERLGLKPPMVHAANSYAIFNYPEAHYDFVRSGAAIHGLIPEPGLKEAATLLTHITDIDFLPKGTRCGYGHINNIAMQDTWRATIAMGYGDGMPREYDPTNPPIFHIAGWPVPMFGNSAMDKTALDITKIYDSENQSIKPGDPVLVFGDLSEYSVPISIAAEKRSTIPARLLAQIAARVPRYYALDKDKTT